MYLLIHSALGHTGQKRTYPLFIFFSGAQSKYSGANVIISVTLLLRLSHKLENNIHMFLLIGNRLGIFYLF